MKMVKMIGDAKMIQDIDPTHKKQFVRAGWAELVEAPQKFKEPEVKILDYKITADEKEVTVTETITGEVKKIEIPKQDPPKHKGGRGNKKLN